MHFLQPLLRNSSLIRIFFVAALAVVTSRMVHAEALLVVEADTGKVLQADNATMPWYPASVTKMMTAYATLKAVKDGKLSLDTLFTVSPVAASQSPSKMGLRPGTQVTVENALAMMLVKSANDMAVVLAEGVGGSIDGFSAIMNEHAQRLGMTQTSYVNPNGLPADGQITSARDLAILARAIIRDLPEYEYFYHIPSIRYGRRVTNNFNHLIGRYPGADGFKTGFICASGYNLVGSATRNGRRLIAVVLGSSSGHMRAVRAAQLLERGFAANGLSWLRPSLGTVDNLAPIDASPPNLRDEMCGGKRHKPASDEDEETSAANAGGSASGGESAVTFFTAGLQPPMLKPSALLAEGPVASEPMVVYTGPKRTGAALIAAVAADTEKQATPRRGKKSRVAARKPDAAASPKNEAKTEAKTEAKSDAKPAPVRHANAKPDAAPKAAEKPAATAAKPAAKPAKPKAAAKPKTETKPAG
ncbi:D-alanyl-D-alanine carboxypeptidase family protein [Bradyrhizobium sp. Ash2021]|uniref:D-alanyl-D-alanine carboxypeptidase family protein n=1 Tax=Bradyrhizobium sp. Ash2021 TaxID=2954771 RepID=UPI0028150ED2|nr:D-alanyl-D-alanine carboxypeptidase family protein [Bradyrhizobium sp. Ash2021]WMT76026.1 D-alanyl-D-alanine carboxypeptidase [Bradyrhizobium sp. Ash2021]